jgi:hypothetical protein
MPVRDSSHRQTGFRGPRTRKPSLSREIEDLSRDMSVSLRADGLSPSAHSALLALLSTLAELLEEAPLTS